MLFAVGPSKPSSRAVRSRSRGSVEPASAPDPRGQREIRRAQVGEARAIAGEQLDEGEPVVGEAHGLRALQMGVAGQQRVEVLAGAQHERLLEPEQAALRGAGRVAQVEREVRRDLVVAAAAGVEAPGHRPDQVAQARLDVHVHVLEARVEGELAPLDLPADALRARRRRASASSAERIPAAPSIEAWAIEPRRS